MVLNGIIINFGRFCSVEWELDHCLDNNDSFDNCDITLLICLIHIFIYFSFFFLYTLVAKLKVEDEVSPGGGIIL